MYKLIIKRIKIRLQTVAKQHKNFSLTDYSQRGSSKFARSYQQLPEGVRINNLSVKHLID